MKKFNRKTKMDKGITLVALVVTIIVLLILAGVSITSIFKQDGIFKKAGEAANKWNEALQNEAGYLSEIEQLYNDYSGKAPRKADYADLDGDGVADGVIYADLTKGKSGVWDGVDVEQLVELLVQQNGEEVRESAKQLAESYKEQAKETRKIYNTNSNKWIKRI